MGAESEAGGEGLVLTPSRLSHGRILSGKGWDSIQSSQAPSSYSGKDRLWGGEGKQELSVEATVVVQVSDAVTCTGLRECW